MPNNVYKVCEVNTYIKNMFMTDGFLSNVAVKGEVSNLKYHGSGHIYFTLKDEKSAISCVMFASKRSGLKFQMTDGAEVTVTGSVDVYDRDGKYQIYASKIEKTGTGNLFEQFEKLKQKLSEMGMFDPIYKQPIPKYIKKLGVVTAPTGAAVRDIIDVSKRRNPGIEIFLFPAIVQGDDAPESVVAGIKALEKFGVDTIIIGRGGGSIEDLWGFNDEKVAEAIFNCSVPIISAVGHETDFTIADFVSDLRAPTPSAAAELAVCDMRAVIESVKIYRGRLERTMLGRLRTERMYISNLRDRLSALSPEKKVKDNRIRLENSKDKLVRIMDYKLSESHHRLEVLAGRLNGLSPLNKLGRGYVFANTDKGPVKDLGDINTGDNLDLYLKDGLIKATVTDKQSLSIFK